MLSSKRLSAWHGERVREKRRRDLRTALLFGLAFAGLTAAGIYLLYVRSGS